MRNPLLAAVLLALPAAAIAQGGAQTGEPPQRIRNVQVRRGEVCPKAGPGRGGGVPAAPGALSHSPRAA